MERLCVSIDRDRCLEDQVRVSIDQSVDLGVKKQQQLEEPKYSWIQTKVLFQIDSEVEQVIDPNRNQMEQSEGLEVVAAKEVEVGLSGSQPWKRDPMNPINLSGSHKDLNQTQIGTEDEGQRSSSKLSNVKGNLGKRGVQIQIGSKIDSRIWRREINWIN